MAIEITDVERDYYKCESCMRNQEENDIVVKKIILSFDDRKSSVNSFRLCVDCFNELETKFNKEVK